MRTSKPFSTISYNTDAFLQAKLDELVQAGVLDFWVYVNHLPEKDETKSHKHLFCVPSRLYDTASFCEYLKELDIAKPDKKPLGCIACHSSKFGDWFLYSCHDKYYLASKGQSRSIEYQLKDFVSSDDDYFNELRQTCDLAKLNRMHIIIDAIEKGQSFQSLAIKGLIPIPQINYWEKFYYMCQADYTYRADGELHSSEDIV